MEIPITSIEDIGIASAYLHDAIFSRSDLVYDEAAKSATLTLWREIWDDGSTKRGLWGLFRESMHVRAVLAFNAVANCNMTKSDELDRYEIDTLSFQELTSTVHLHGTHCIDIEFVVTDLNGTLKDIGQPQRIKSGKITLGWPSFFARNNQAE